MATNCAICLKDCDDPRSLPCLHIFCNGCIGAYLQADENHGSNGTGRCPIGAENCASPSSAGTAAAAADTLRRNVFVEDLVAAKKAAEAKEREKWCAVCGNETQRYAFLFCQTCERMMCEGCGRACRQSAKRKKKSPASATEIHRVVDIQPTSTDADYKKVLNEMERKSVYCEWHVAKLVEDYCTECKVVLCVECRAGGHGSHVVEKISDVLPELREQLDYNIALSCCGRNGAEFYRKSTTNDSGRKLREMATCATDQITRRAAEINEFVDSDRKQILEEIKSAKRPAEKEIDARLEYVERALGAVESFIAYYQAVKENGSPVDLARLGDVLMARAKQIKSAHAGQCVQGTEFREIRLEASELDEIVSKVGGMKTLVGSVTVDTKPSTDVYIMNARPGISVSTNLPSRVIRGLAYCNGKLFVVTERNDSVLVYDVQNRNKQLPSLKVAGLREPRDIAACPETCCVYAAEWTAYCSRVWRVSTLDGRVDGWLPNMASTAPLATPLSLSIRSRRVLVTTGNELRLTGSDGEELKRVKVKVSLLRHAVETATGTFIICCGDVSGPNVVEVGDDGHVIRAYSGPLPLKNACCLSMHSDGRVLVSGGETMLLLSPQLGILQVLRNSRFYDLHKMCFVENVGLLVEFGSSSVSLTMMAVRRL